MLVHRNDLQRLKVRLLKASNQEAQFRLDLETRVSQGIWNQYDVGSYQNEAVDFVVYKSGGATRDTQHGRSHALAMQRRRSGSEDDEQVESWRVDTSGAPRGRAASGKFEKNQVLPLTEWLLKHSKNPYPSMEDKAALADKSGLSTQQVQNWFINMRKRHWTPMMNGKRRPRTFLDYVILSSQEGAASSKVAERAGGGNLRRSGGSGSGGGRNNSAAGTGTGNSLGGVTLHRKAGPVSELSIADVSAVAVRLHL